MERESREKEHERFAVLTPFCCYTIILWFYFPYEGSLSYVSYIHTFHIHSKFCSYIILSYLFILYSLFSIHQLFWILALATALSCKKIEHSILEHLPLPRTCLHLYWSNNLVGPVTPRNNFHLFFSYLAEDKSSQNLYAISSELFKSIIMISLLGLTFTVTIVNFSFFLLL